MNLNDQTIRYEQALIFVLVGWMILWGPDAALAVFGDQYESLRGKVELQVESVEEVVSFGTPIRLPVRLENTSDEKLAVPELSDITVLTQLDGTSTHRDGSRREMELAPGDTVIETITITRDPLKPGEHKASVNYLGIAETDVVTVRVQEFPGWEERWDHWQDYRQNDSLDQLQQYLSEHREDTDPITQRMSREYFRRLAREGSDPRGALRELEKTLEAFPGDVQLRELKGEFLMKAGKDRAAIEAWTGSTREGFDRAVDWYEQRHDREMSADQFEEFIQLGTKMARRAQENNYDEFKARTEAAMAYAHYHWGNVERAIRLAEDSIPEVAREWKREAR